MKKLTTTQQVFLGLGVVGFCGMGLVGCGGGSSMGSNMGTGLTSTVSTMGNMRLSVQVHGLRASTSATSVFSLVFQVVLAGTTTPVGAAVPVTLSAADVSALASNQPIASQTFTVPAGVNLQVVVTPEVNGVPTGTPGETAAVTVGAGQTQSLSASVSFVAGNTGPHMFLLGQQGGKNSAVRLDGIPTVTGSGTLNVSPSGSELSIEANGVLDEAAIMDAPDNEELLAFQGADEGTNLSATTNVSVLNQEDAVPAQVAGVHLLATTGINVSGTFALDILSFLDPQGTLNTTAIDPSDTASGNMLRVDPALNVELTLPTAFVMDANGNLLAYLNPFQNGNVNSNASFSASSFLQPIAIDYDAANHVLYVLAEDNLSTLEVFVVSAAQAAIGFNLTTPTFTLTTPVPGSFDSGNIVSAANAGIAVDVPIGAPSPAFMYLTFNNNGSQQIFFIPNPPSTPTATPITPTLFTGVPAGFTVSKMAVDDNAQANVSRPRP